MTNVEGLTSAMALRLQEEEGFNELPISSPRKLHTFIAQVLREPMVFLLIACGLIYFILGDRQEAVILTGFLLLIVGITVYQERKAERALEALRDLSSPRALVLRDGERRRIPGREIVRGDIVFIHEGDRVPADGVVLSGLNLAADESLLTGESIPVEKPPGAKLHAGTTIVRGQSVARILAVGLWTELGKIGRLIQNESPEATRLEIQTRALVWKLSWISISLCAVVVVVYGLTRQLWLDGFLAGLSLAMAILPNELPAVLTIFLALGAWRMSQRRVLTRKMSAIENLGAATVLCVDKTGTLTLNRMTVQELNSSGERLVVSGRTENSIPESFHEILEFGVLASRQDPFDPMEQAFHVSGDRYLKGTEHLHPDWSLEREYPLSPDQLSITHVWKSGEGGGYVVGAKGAPEAIVDLCHLDKAEAETISKRAMEMAGRGLRVLGVAKSKMAPGSFPIRQHDFEFEFIGLIGLADPIRPGVPTAISECNSAGVRVVMITGDHPSTARSIAAQIGLKNPEKVVTGVEFARMSEEELRTVAREISVFSRMMPEQKLQLVNLLKSAGEIVAMTGDGVNDAPALRSAHIGIAMGGRGTDVARESAAIVLLDDDFASIVEAIRMGRRVYTNLRSAFVYLLAAHIPIAGISVLPVVMKLPLVLLPVHIAFLHLIIEPACSIVYEAEPVEEGIMRRPPRRPTENLFNGKAFLPSLVRGVSGLAALALVFLIALSRGQGEYDARALTFTTLIVSNLTLILMSRRAAGRNRTLGLIVGGSLVMLACVLYIPGLRDLFRFSTLHPTDLAICLGLGVASVAWVGLLAKRDV